MNFFPAQVDNGLPLQYADDTIIICAGVTPTVVQITMCVAFINTTVDFTE